MFRKRCFAASLAPVLALIPGMVFPQVVEQPDNFAVYQKLFDKVAVHITNQVSADGETAIVVPLFEDQASPRTVLRAQAIKSAIEKGLSVFSTDSLLKGQSYLRVAFPLLNCATEYSQVRHGFLWRRGTLRRQAMIEVSIEIIEQPSTRVVMQEFFKAGYADTVRSSEIRRLENPRYAFTIGREPRRSVRSQLMEPLLLAVSTGAAIYALYALRSR